MPLNNSFGFLVDNPLVTSPFTQNYDFPAFLPPPPGNFMITEDGNLMITEDGNFMIIE